MSARKSLIAGLLWMALSAAGAWATPVQGVVLNKSTGKPSAGDKVVLVDVGQGMTDAATSKTDAEGKFTLTPPGVGPYIVRAEHQGGSYFVGAPKEGAQATINVYDVAEKLDGVSLDADLVLIETKDKMLRAQERFLIRNQSQPPRAQFSSKTFEFVLPEGALLDSASATRPGGMATNVPATPLKEKGHYTINVPIQPSFGDKETTFEIQYHMVFSGKQELTLRPLMAADSVEIYLAKGVQFSAPDGAGFKNEQPDPRVEAYILKNVAAGQLVKFTVSGEGQLPRDEAPASGSMGAASGAGDDSGAASGMPAGPGGGIGAPMASPDPLSKYKGWLLAGLVLLMAAAAAWFLRKQQGAGTSVKAVPAAMPMAFPEDERTAMVAEPVQSPSQPQGGMLTTLKDELFALESSRLAGTIDANEYAEAKAALEVLMKRAMKTRDQG